MRNPYGRASERRVDGMTRDEVCHRYHRKVVLLARRVFERLSPESTATLDDLVSSGGIGLLEAFDRFDPTRGIQFTTFAEYRVRGAMYDDLRKNDPFTRRRRELAKRVEYARTTLARDLDRAPTPQECADFLEMDLEDYWLAEQKVRPVQHMSLDYTDEEDGEERPLLERLMDQDTAAPDAQLRMRDLRRTLAEAIKDLPERQRHCIMLYYGKELSLAEIAAVFEVTVSRISQILSEARGKLKKRLEVVLEPADFAGV
ncbi:MAG: sigma-70 family RNA polymerase sigma factor [Myxococcota bacterium]